jgi:HAD superfamily hydrolase (TIGR01509 family)
VTSPLPWARIQAVFLDVGHTLVGLDLGLLEQGLAELGLAAGEADLVRAEAAARPDLSRLLAAGEGRRRDSFVLLLEGLLRRLFGPGPELERDAERLARTLRAGRASDDLWKRPLPGARAALERLAALGLPCVAVSNSDGTAEKSLERAGLRPWIRAVVDSHVVGAEKPDPHIFRAALALVGMPPERVVHAGDLHAIDVVGAESAGIHAVLLDPFHDWYGVDCTCLRDVGELVDGLARARRMSNG